MKTRVSTTEIDNAFNLAETNSYAPSLFVGCGGFGSTIINQLKNRYRQFFDDGRPDPFPFARFLSIDTAPLEKSEVHQLSLAEDPECFRINVRADATFLASPKVKRWFPGTDRYPGMADCLYRVGDTSTGAGTCRPIGHLGLYQGDAASRLQQRLHDILEGLYTAAATRQSVTDRYGNGYTLRDANRLYVYVVTSLGGGTGTANFLTVAALIRDIFQRKRANNEWPGRTCFLSMVLLTPTCIRAPSGGDTAVAANSYAALKELDHLLEPGRVYEERFPDGFSVTLLNDQPDKALADRVFIVDNPVSDGPVSLEKRIDMAELVSDCLFQLSIGEIGNHFWTRDIDSTLWQEWHPSGAANRPECRRTRYYALGAAHYELPAGYLFDRLTHDFVAEFLRDQERELAGGGLAAPDDATLEDDFLRQEGYQAGVDGFFSTDEGKAWEERLLLPELEKALSESPAELAASTYFPYKALVVETPEDENEILESGRQAVLEALERYIKSAVDPKAIENASSRLLEDFLAQYEQLLRHLDERYRSAKNRQEILGALHDIVQGYADRFQDVLDDIDASTGAIDDLRQRRQENYERICNELESWSLKGIITLKVDELLACWQQTAGRWLGSPQTIPATERSLLQEALEDFIDTDRKLDLLDYRQKVSTALRTLLTDKILPQIARDRDAAGTAHDIAWRAYRDQRLDDHQAQTARFDRLRDLLATARALEEKALHDHRFDGSAFYTSFENTRFYPKRTHRPRLLEEIYGRLKAEVKRQGLDKTFRNRCRDLLRSYLDDPAYAGKDGPDLATDLAGAFRAALGIYQDDGRTLTLDWGEVTKRFRLDLEDCLPHSAAGADSELGRTMRFLREHGRYFVDLESQPAAERLAWYLLGPKGVTDKIVGHGLVPANTAAMAGLYPHQLSLYAFLRGFSLNQLRHLRNWHRAYWQQRYRGEAAHVLAGAEDWPEPYTVPPVHVDGKRVRTAMKRAGILKAIGRTGKELVELPGSSQLLDVPRALGRLRLVYKIEDQEALDGLRDAMDALGASAPVPVSDLPATLPTTGENTFDVNATVWFCMPGKKTRYWLVPVRRSLEDPVAAAPAPGAAAAKPVRWADILKADIPCHIFGSDTHWEAEFAANHALHAWCSRRLLDRALSRREVNERLAAVQNLLDEDVLTPAERDRAEIFRNLYIER